MRHASGIMDGIDHNYTRMLPQPAVFRLRFQEENILSADRLLSLVPRTEVRGLLDEGTASLE
jgi:hypothetical protein